MEKILETTPTMVLKEVIKIARDEIQRRDTVIYTHHRDFLTKKGLILVGMLLQNKQLLELPLRKMSLEAGVSIAHISGLYNRLKVHGFLENRKLINCDELQRLYDLRLKNNKWKT